MAKLSVIVPIYNVEKYLRQCLESIVNQTFRDLEIILVDDGSPDKCGEICDEYAKKDNRIIVIHKANGGLSAARNDALNIATGEWIALPIILIGVCVNRWQTNYVVKVAGGIVLAVPVYFLILGFFHNSNITEMKQTIKRKIGNKFNLLHGQKGE